MVEVQLVTGQGNDEAALDAADREAAETNVRHTHEEMFYILREANQITIKYNSILDPL